MKKIFLSAFLEETGSIVHLLENDEIAILCHQEHRDLPKYYTLDGFIDLTRRIGTPPQMIQPTLEYFEKARIYFEEKLGRILIIKK